MFSLLIAAPPPVTMTDIPDVNSLNISATMPAQPGKIVITLITSIVSHSEVVHISW